MKKLIGLSSLVLAALALVLVTTLAQHGDLDPTWGEGGKTLTSFGEGDHHLTANALMNNGKWVLAGTVNDYPGDFGTARYLPDGKLDPSFGEGGQVVTTFVDDPDQLDSAWATAERPNDGLYVAGYTCTDSFICELAVAAYLEDGSLDAAFDGDGTVTTYLGTPRTLAWPGRLIVHADGSLTTGGIVFDDYSRVNMVMVSYNPDGSLDESFGAGGIAITDLAGADEFPTDLLALPDDKILTTGVFGAYIYPGSTVSHAAFLARMNGDGSLDTTFGGGDGYVTWENNDRHVEANMSILTPDNHIMVFGSVASDYGADCTLRRYSLEGVLDTAFGTNGQVIIDSGQDDWCRDLALTPDGQLAMAWSAMPYIPGEPDARNARSKATTSRRTYAQSRLIEQTRQAVEVQSFESVLARYNLDGTPDRTFGLYGIRRYSSAEEGLFSQLAVQPDGKFLVGGEFRPDRFAHFAALRFVNTQSVPAQPGALDPTWGDEGLATVEFSENRDIMTTAVLDPDGKVTIAGWVNGYPGDFGVTRLRPDGRLDPSFGDGGKVTTRFTADPDSPNAPWSMGRRANGGYVVSGNICDPDYVVCEWGTAVYLPDGSLDTSFSDDGLVITGMDDVFTLYAWPYRMVTQADSGVVIGGVVIQNDDDVDIALRRYKADGTLDAAYGDDGIALYDFEDTSNYIESMRPMPGNKILATGGFGETIDASSYEIDQGFLALFNDDGSLDMAFGNDGYVTWDQNGEGALPEDLIVGPAGEILVVGIVPLADGGLNCALWRFDADGNQDLAFGEDGILRIDTGRDEICTGIDLLPDGMLAVVGHVIQVTEESRSTTSFGRHWAGRPSQATTCSADQGDSLDGLVARINPDGTLDATFGEGGIVVYDEQGTDNPSFVLAAQPDGKLVIVGDLTDPVSELQSMYAARLLGDGPAAQVYAPVIGR